MKSVYVYLLSVTLILSFGANCFGEELVQGKVIGTTQDKLGIAMGEEAIINLGRNNSVIKGDIFEIIASKDIELTGAIGKCAVIKTYDTTSICKIIKSKVEIEKGNIVSCKKVLYSNDQLYPLIFKVLDKLVEPYAPNKEITVYIYNFFDDKNNVTEFSEKLKKEMKNVYAQKNRIKLIGDETGRGIFVFPDQYSYEELIKFMEDYMRKDSIDVLITGTYKTNNENIELTIYHVDKNWEDLKFVFSISSKDYGESLSKVTVPYKQLARQEAVCNLSYKPFYYVPRKDEKKDVVLYESEKNPFIEYDITKSDFNIISPLDFKLKVDNSTVKFDGRSEYKIALPIGTHTISASFKRGFYYNDSLVYTSNSELKKDILLSIDKTDDVNIEIYINPVFGKENINFKIYKRIERDKKVLKPIIQSATEKPIEVYKD